MSRTLKASCKFCGDDFLAQRSTAKFCTPKHRIAYNRLEGRIETLMNAALDYMWDIDKIAKDHSDTINMAIAALQTAEDYIEHKKLKLLEQRREQS